MYVHFKFNRLLNVWVQRIFSNKISIMKLLKSVHLVYTRKPLFTMTFQPRLVGHLTVQLARIVGILIGHFEKSQMPGGLPGGLPGGGMISLGID